MLFSASPLFLSCQRIQILEIMPKDGDEIFLQQDTYGTQSLFYKTRFKTTKF